MPKILAETITLAEFEPCYTISEVDAIAEKIPVTRFKGFFGCDRLTIRCPKRYLYFRLTKQNLENQI